MPQVDHFRSRGLNDAPHDIDGRIMTIEQGGRSDNAYMVLWFVGCWSFRMHGSWMERMTKIGKNGERRAIKEFEFESEFESAGESERGLPGGIFIIILKIYFRIIA
jgi:hypothetical protein